MRVLLVTPSYSPIKGGVETIVENLATELNQIGVHADVMTFNMTQKWKPHWRTRTEKLPNFDVYRIPAVNWFPMAHSKRITMGIDLIPGRFRDKLRRYDLLHFHVGDLTFPVFSWGVRKPKIAHFHGPLGVLARNFISRSMLKNIADFHIVASREIENELIDVGIQSSRIEYLPNAVDTDVFQPGGTKEENLILFIGRIEFGKGLHILLRSLRYLRTQIRVVIIGPPGWNARYCQEIQNQMDLENRNGVHRITYLGSQGQDNIIRWCQKASIFVLPSFREAFSVAVLEAMSCGTPVVATRIGGLVDAVSNGKTGILISTNNSLDLASSIQYLLDNEPVRTHFGREGRKRVMNNFSLDLYVKAICQIYSEFA